MLLVFIITLRSSLCSLLCKKRSRTIILISDDVLRTALFVRTGTSYAMYTFNWLWCDGQVGQLMESTHSVSAKRLTKQNKGRGEREPVYNATESAKQLIALLWDY